VGRDNDLPHFKELCDGAERLQQLLNDPHSELPSWLEQTHKTIKAIGEAWGFVFEEGSTAVSDEKVPGKTRHFRGAWVRRDNGSDPPCAPWDTPWSGFFDASGKLVASVKMESNGLFKVEFANGDGDGRFLTEDQAVAWVEARVARPAEQWRGRGR
jgi:hypothetical protein